MNFKEFLDVFTVTDLAGGRKIKATAALNDMSDILTTSDPTYGRRIKIDLTGYSPFTVVANYSALPLPADATGQFYWCENSEGTWWLPGSLGGTYYNSGMYYSNGISWSFTEVPYQATQATVNAGIVTDQFVSPDTLNNYSGWNKTKVGLGNVDNTSDINKPISTATQTALNLKQNTITLTTTGSSGAATFAADTLNIPVYSSNTKFAQTFLLMGA